MTTHLYQRPLLRAPIYRSDYLPVIIVSMLHGYLRSHSISKAESLTFCLQICSSQFPWMASLPSCSNHCSSNACIQSITKSYHFHSTIWTVFPFFSVLIAAILVITDFSPYYCSNFLTGSPLCFAPKSVLHPAFVTYLFLFFGKIFTEMLQKTASTINVQLMAFCSLRTPI